MIHIVFPTGYLCEIKAGTSCCYTDRHAAITAAGAAGAFKGIEQRVPHGRPLWSFTTVPCTNGCAKRVKLSS